MPIINAADIAAKIGTEIGVSDWADIGQDRINAFADCTEDHQFIHVDAEKAAATPFGGTIAHGFLTLSMLSKFAEQTALTIEGIQMGINYGFETVRFLAPVKSGKRLRGRFVLKDAAERKPGQWRVVYEVTAEIEGEEKPALTAEWVTIQMVK